MKKMFEILCRGCRKKITEIPYEKRWEHRETDKILDRHKDVILLNTHEFCHDNNDCWRKAKR